MTADRAGGSRRRGELFTGMDIGFLVFPEITQLDLTGPLEVLSRIDGVRTHLISKTRDPVRSDRGFILTPTCTFKDAPLLHVMCVPGGPGIDLLLNDAETVAFVRDAATSAKYVTSVCTGSLLLGAAGLLKNKRAGCHWYALPLLHAFGATPDSNRVVRDGNLITAGGVTSGIDFALVLVAEMYGNKVAQEVQLALQYDPRPPFTAGTPETAPDDVVTSVRELFQQRGDRRRAIIDELMLGASKK